MRVVLAALAAALLLQQPAAGAETRWVPVPIRTAAEKAAGLRGGEGFQMVHGLAYAPSDPSIAYLSTDTSQVWKSTDGGRSWTPKHRGFLAYGAKSLAVDPTNPKVVLAAGFTGDRPAAGLTYAKRLQGIYRTADGGESWELVRRTDFFKQESKGSLIVFAAGAIYAGSFGEGLLRSSDGGDTWLGAGFAGREIVDLKPDPSPSRRGSLYVCTTKGFFRRAPSGAVEELGKGLPAWPRSVAVSPAAPGLLYAALGEAGLHVSRNGGVAFQQCVLGVPPGTTFTDVAASPADGRIAYAKADRSGVRPLFTRDAGVTWQPAVSTDLPRLGRKEGFWASGPIAPHPTDPRQALLGANGRDCVLRTSDGGATWSYSSEGFTGGRMRAIAFDGQSRMIFCLTDFGLWTTEDGGDTFRELDVGRVFGQQSSASCASQGDAIVASLGTWKEKGLRVSRDRGKTWKTFEGKDDYPFLAFHPERDGVVYAGPYRSADGGETWTRLAHPVRALSPGDGDALYSFEPAGTGRSVLLRSSDQGASWARLGEPAGFSAKEILDVAVAPGASGGAKDVDRILVASTRGVWVFDGAFWSLRTGSDGLAKDAFGETFVQAVAVDPRDPRRVYAGRRAGAYGESNGVFRSCDGGLTWSSASANLGPALTVWAVEISPESGDVYLGTSFGTFRLAGASQECSSPSPSHEVRVR